MSYCSELASGELQDLEFSKCCWQDFEFSKCCRQDIEFSKPCRQDFKFSKSCETRVNLVIFKIFIAMLILIWLPIRHKKLYVYAFNYKAARLSFDYKTILLHFAGTSYV